MRRSRCRFTAGRTTRPPSRRWPNFFQDAESSASRRRMPSPAAAASIASASRCRDRGRMTSLTVAALQLAFTDSAEENIAAVSELVREAAGRGAKLVLPPELFEGHYFCRTQDESHFGRALPAGEHPVVLA